MSTQFLKIVMVNQQGSDQVGFPPTAPTRKSTKARSSRRETTKQTPFWLKLFAAFTQRHPFLLWSGVWLMMLLLTWVSVRSLIHIDPLAIETQAEIAVEASQTPNQPRFNAKPASSFGLLAAIALGCGGISFLLARQLTPAQPPRRLVTKAKPRRTVRQPDPSRVAIAAPMRSTPATQQPVVTVVPLEEAHPLDWGDANLADMMDIRKQQSVSSLM